MFNVLSKPFFQGQIIARFPNTAGKVIRVFCVNGCIFLAMNPLTGADTEKIAAITAESFATYKAITDTTAANYIKIEATFTDADIAQISSQATLEAKTLINVGFGSYKVLTDLPNYSTFVENHEALSVTDTLFTVKMAKYVAYLSESLKNHNVVHLSFNQYSAI